MIIPDVNMLLYAHTENETGLAAREWWDDLLAGTEEIGLPWGVVMGFLRVSTNPKMQANPLTPEAALAAVDDWFRYPQVLTVNPGPRHLALVTEILAPLGTGGNLVSDVHIAAIAIEHDAEVHTRDNDFARFPGLRWRNPLRTEA